MNRLRPSWTVSPAPSGDYDPALVTVDEIRHAAKDVGYRVAG